METLLCFFLSSLVLVACFLFVSLFFFFFSSLFSWLSLSILSLSILFSLRFLSVYSLLCFFVLSSFCSPLCVVLFLLLCRSRVYGLPSALCPVPLPFPCSVVVVFTGEENALACGDRGDEFGIIGDSGQLR